MNTKTAYSLLFTIICTLLINCTPARVINETSTPANKILFLAYELKKDTLSGDVSANVIQQIIADGQIKEEEKNETAKANDLQIIFLSKDGKEIKQTVIKAPFIQHLEGIGNNNQLERKEIEQSRAEVTLRTSLSPLVQKVVLNYLDNKGNKKLLLQHQLNN